MKYGIQEKTQFLTRELHIEIHRGIHSSSIELFCRNQRYTGSPQAFDFTVPTKNIQT